VEVFTSSPPCSGGRLLPKLIEETEEEYKDKIEVEIYQGICEKPNDYLIQASPTVVIDVLSTQIVLPS